MKNSVIIHSSNTEAMANAIAEGMKKNEVNISVITVGNATIEDVKNADYVALGCPMIKDIGSELKKTMELVENLKNLDLKKKRFALFGTQDTGDTTWIEDWRMKIEDFGADFVGEGLILDSVQDSDDNTMCGILGTTLTDVSI